MSLSSPFADAYFRPKSWEIVRGTTIYSFIGIRFYKTFIPISRDGLIHQKHRISGDIDTLDALQLYERKTRVYELRHWFGIMGTIIIACYVPHQFTLFDYSFLLLLTLIVNIYPITLQRHNRIRIYKVINMLKTKHSS